MQYIEIASSATFYLKGSPGYLQGITVNNPGTSWTLQIFDGKVSDTAIAGATAFAIPAAGTYLDYDCNFSKGLTIVTSGTAGSITVEYT